MKNVLNKSLFLIGLILMLGTACKEKNSEQKIAELEKRLAEAEAKKALNPPSTQEVLPENTETKPDGPLAEFKFETMDHDFGTIKEGDVVKYTYKFKNVGDAPLIIQDAKGSCGCTVPNWTKDPIPAGGEGVVTAEFNSSGKHDAQNKTITITANTFPKQTTLHLKAMITPKATESPKK